MNSWQEQWHRGRDALRERWALADFALWRVLLLLLLVFAQLGLAWYWSREPRPLVPAASTAAAPCGVRLMQAATQVVQTLLHKPGGYLRNDIAPPGLLLDDLPSWELGVIGQLRDLSQVLAQERPEDSGLRQAAAALQSRSDAWALPSAEQEYQQAQQQLQHYQNDLAHGHRPPLTSHFVQAWLLMVEQRLLRQSADLNGVRPDQALSAVAGATAMARPRAQATPWWQVDDVFYQARGSAWALMHLLRALEADFAPALAQHGAQLSLRAAIHELEATQQTLWSPVILNGSGFGLFANHSLIMANYLQRAQIDLADVRMQLAAAPAP